VLWSDGGKSAPDRRERLLDVSNSWPSGLNEGVIRTRATTEKAAICHERQAWSVLATANVLAYFKNTNGTEPDSWDNVPGKGRLGQITRLERVFRISPTVGAHATFIDVRMPRGELAVPYSQLPAEFLEEDEQQSQQILADLRKQGRVETPKRVP
jgi:hypothetical protein